MVVITRKLGEQVAVCQNGERAAVVSVASIGNRSACITLMATKQLDHEGENDAPSTRAFELPAFEEVAFTNPAQFRQHLLQIKTDRVRIAFDADVGVEFVRGQ